MDDLISRQAAIDAINTWDKFGVDERSRIVRWHEGLEPYVHLRDVLTAIVNLPPAQPTLQPTCNQLATDIVNRQMAIDAIEHRLAEPAYQHTGEDWYVGMNCAESELYNLPSAQPERKKGKWIKEYWNADIVDGFYVPKYECSECHAWKEDDSNYCPDCGADMREENDD